MLVQISLIYFFFGFGFAFFFAGIFMILHLYSYISLNKKLYIMKKASPRKIPSNLMFLAILGKNQGVYSHWR